MNVDPVLLDLASTYLHLRADDGATTMEGGAAFWAGIDDRRDLDSGRLCAMFEQTADWDHWERHPAGPELLVTIRGRMELLIEHDDRARTVVSTIMAAGQAMLVPTGLWHRAKVLEPGRLLAITAGAGTEHRAVDATKRTI